MKTSLLNLKSFQTALENVSAKSSIDHDNGTFGRSYKGWFYDQEVYELGKDKAAHTKELAEAVLAGDFAKVGELHNTKPDGEKKVNIIFKLFEPITIDSTYQIRMNVQGKKISEKFSVTVDTIKIPLEIAQSDLVSATELDLDCETAGGEQTKAIELSLDKCMIDAYQAKKNWDGTVWLAEYVKVVAISRRSLQILGVAENALKNEARKAHGILSDAKYKEVFGDFNPYAVK